MIIICGLGCSASITASYTGNDGLSMSAPQS
mgnify:CR=1 FL=1